MSVHLERGFKRDDMEMSKGLPYSPVRWIQRCGDYIYFLTSAAGRQELNGMPVKRFVRQYALPEMVNTKKIMSYVVHERGVVFTMDGGVEARWDYPLSFQESPLNILNHADSIRQNLMEVLCE